jgi:hypothetical protein
MSLIDNPKELLELINDCLKPKEIEKKQFGEVFTPMKIINDMLDKLPQEIWTNKNLKWFDPANGMGNFPIAIYLRLMETLKDEIKDKNERKKHILENMLYMSEINKKNVLITKQIFDINNEYKLNIYEGDSLELKPLEIFQVKEFDIIIGNPPYNDASGNKGKGHTLWTKFVKKSLNKWSKNGSYISLIHPSLWRQIDNEIFEEIKKYNLLYLNINNDKEGQKIFSCGTRFDWYILLKEKNNNKITTINGEDKKEYKININKWKFLPNKEYTKIIDLISDNEDDKLEICNYRSNYGADKKWINNKKNNEYKYPCIYSINKNDEPNLKYSKINTNGHFGLKKFIFSNGLGFIKDIDGIYGLTQWANCIYDNKESIEEIYKCFKNIEFQEKIISSIKLDSSTYNIKVMKLFKKDFYKKFI